MFESIINFFKKIGKAEGREAGGSKDKAKERLHLVLMQDRANVSADFLELMKQEIIDVIKKYIEVEEGEIDVRLTNEVKDDGTTGAPSLYANIPIVNIKNDMKKETTTSKTIENKQQPKKEEPKPEKKSEKKNETVVEKKIEEKTKKSEKEEKIEEKKEKEQEKEEKQEESIS